MADKSKGQQGGLQDFTLVENFKWGYRNREDKTTLPPGVLVEGSQNVLTNTFQRVANRKGYTLDGAANTDLAPIVRSFDWFTSKGYERNMRAGFLTSAGNDGKLQYRYVASDGTVTWRDLLTGLTSVDFNFTTFWDFTTEKIDVMLAVNGSSNIYEWSGGVTTIASVGTNTLTKQGTETWGELGFYLTGTTLVTINGVDYTYTGGEGTTTLTGVTPDPALAAPPIAAGDIAHQTVRVTANSAMTSIPAAFPNALIANLYNQIYIGALTDNSVYISNVNDYKDYSFATPRVVGEGALVTLGSTTKALIPQENAMYMSAGKDEWYETAFTLSADITTESLTVQKLSTTTQQAAISQLATSKIKNSVVFLSNEPIINTFGRVDNVVLTPQMTDISFSIVNDMNNYDFTGAAMFYYRKFVYVAVPAESLVLMYNMTDPKNPYWEAPQVIPISCFSIIGGELYGHSSQVSETYKLFDGYNDNGVPIDAIAMFSFNNYGSRSTSKGYNQFYVEGYITSNTTLTLGIQYETDGCATETSYDIVGTDTQIVCLGGDDNSLGKNSLGKQPLGSLIIPSSATLPPKFRVIRTFPIHYFYEDQISFESITTDSQWEIICFGPQLTSARDLNISISQ